MIVCGIMTGTSLDGIDITVCDFGKSPSLENDFKLLYYYESPFPSLLRADLQRIITDGFCTLKELSQLNISYTKAIADAVRTACDVNSFDLSRIDLIGMHGQTLWHNPQKESFGGEDVCSTFQLGSGSALATFLQKTVVHDFRTSDMAVGGQGAPLVPIFDYYFLRSSTSDRIILNIGGISNITYLPKEADENNVKAFDVGPGNTLLDRITKKYFNLDFDMGGEIARSGSLLEKEFEILCKDQFVNAKPPKSTGREYYNDVFLDRVFNSTQQGNDILRTLTQFTAWSICRNIKLYCNDSSDLIISGGGANNKFLVELIKDYLPKSELLYSDDVGIHKHAKEAIAFAYLAWRRAEQLYGNLPSVTGAWRKVLLGSISECY